MFKQLHFSYRSIALLLCLGGCCNDPAIVKIPDSDSSAPTLRWEITVLTQTPGGPISSLTQHADPNNTVTVRKNDEVAVFLVATDNESGVKSLSTQGGFSYACNNPGPGGRNLASIIDGILPKQEVSFNNLTTCALKQWRVKRECFSIAFSCNSGVISNQAITLTGHAENFKGGVSDINLNIKVEE